MNFSDNILKKSSGVLLKERFAHPVLFYFLGVLSLVFSIIFAFERIYGDAAYSLFTLINEERLVMISSRPISMIIEMFPFLFVKMGISIDKIILAFSLNEWMWYFFCALILFYFYKKPTYAIVIYLLQIFGLQWNWFNPVSEFILASPLIFMIGAELQLLMHNKYSFWRLLVLITLVLFCHPFYSVIVPWLLVLYYFANKKDIKELRFRYINIFLIVVIVLHYFFLSGYDVESAAANGRGLFKSLTLRLILNYFKAFPGLIALILLSTYSLFKENRRKEVYVFLLTLLGFFLLVIHKYGHDFPDTYEPYERYLFPIAIVIAFYWFVILQKSWNVLLLIIAFYNIVLFVNYGNRVQTRYREFNYMLTNAQQWDESKIYIRAENYYPAKIGHDWTMPNESMILSSMMKTGITKQVWVKESISNDLFNEINEDVVLASPYYVFSNENVNPHYFKIRKSFPVCANTDSIQSNRPDSFFVNLSIEPLSPYVLKRSSEILIPVKIMNRNREALYSGLKKEMRYISYHWMKDGKTVEWDGVRTPIAMDVKHTNLQLIKIKTPSEPGDYTFVPDIVYEGIRWAMLGNGFKYKIK